MTATIPAPRPPQPTRPHPDSPCASCACQDGQCADPRVQVRRAIVRHTSEHRIHPIPFPEMVERIVADIAPLLTAAAADIPAAVTEPGPDGAPIGLSARHVAALQLLAQGLTRDQIATALGLRPAYVAKLTRRLYDRMGACNAAHAVAIGYQTGHLR